MNTQQTKRVILDNEIITLKADKTHRRKAESVNDLLVALGNYGKTIPFLAIYPAGREEPITLDGLITQDQVIRALNEAVALQGAE